MRPRNGSVLPEQPFKSSPNSTVSSIYNASTIDGNERLLSAANSINAPAAPTSLPLSVPVPVPVPSLSAFYSSPQSLRLNLQNCTDSPRPRRTSTDLTEPPPVFAYTDQTQRANQDVCGPDFHLTTLGCAVQGTQGIQPVKILIERLEAWQIFARRLYDHFEMLSQKEHLLQVHFSFEGGIRQVCDAWQGYHDKRAKDHQAFGLFLQTQWLPSLAAIKREIKWMIRAVRADDRLTLSTLGRLKEEAEKRLDRLDRQLTFFNQHPDHGYNRQDPWLMNAGNL
ncbi:hypothetical protein J3Q64DRAFT_1684914 [Phycomyces blakesleeanus]|uniref:SLM1/RGC1-like BAR-like domain-containing protein n=1 Tax=Phycomyces blakesleeanus TaxID=4837 RepID=A0ABR3AM57_PHYBL